MYLLGFLKLHPWQQYKQMYYLIWWIFKWCLVLTCNEISGIRTFTTDLNPLEHLFPSCTTDASQCVLGWTAPWNHRKNRGTLNCHSLLPPDGPLPQILPHMWSPVVFRHGICFVISGRLNWNGWIPCYSFFLHRKSRQQMWNEMERFAQANLLNSIVILRRQGAGIKINGFHGP